MTKGKKKVEPKEACTMSEVCVSVGDDCTEEGRNARENECFDDGTAKEPVVVDVAPCAELKCRSYNPKLPRNCKVYPPATENGILRCANYKPESLPESCAADGTGEQAAGEAPTGDVCFVCKKPVTDYVPQMCCNGTDCNCMGLPIEPPICSTECADKMFDWSDGQAGIPSVNSTASIPAVPETVTAGGHKTFNRTLPVSLSREELAEHAAEIARLLGVWTEAKLNKQSSDRAFKALIDETEEKYLALAKIVRSGGEERTVPCYWVFDKEHGEKTCYRCDTGDVIEKVNMELLDYDHEPTVEESIKNVKEAFQTTAQEEAAEPSTGEPEEAQGEVAAEEENPATEEISQDPVTCVCENCGESATVEPGSECANCIFGKMESVQEDLGTAEDNL